MAALAASFFAPGAAALAREKTTAHARRSTKNSTATRAAVKSDETAISKPFEVRAASFFLASRAHRATRRPARPIARFARARANVARSPRGIFIVRDSFVEPRRGDPRFLFSDPPRPPLTLTSAPSPPRPPQALVEATSTHPVAAARSESFARTPHYKAACERAVNEQINIEYNVSYIYHAMYAYFARDNVYLPGIAQHFMRESLEERGHAELLMNYQIMRGGRVELQARSFSSFAFTTPVLASPHADWSPYDPVRVVNADP
jgi:hypothetical protein